MDVNIRAAEMWRILRSKDGFKNLNVVDFGCGYGDMMAFMLRDGAAYVLGVDKDQVVLNTAAAKCEGNHRAGFLCADFEEVGVFGTIVDLVGKNDGINMDVALCFSVLPYLEDPDHFVRMLDYYFDVVYIECQYVGDGPGNIARSDDDMAAWLMNAGFNSVSNMGKTLVNIRNKYRTIWECW